ncbi:peptidoglycan-binding protein [Streptomyces cocklensis]|uniref:peptidoglycan-binding domain-containing protein n=1 Tax=Actinacidiphila cocklensis TaxID=887465 RepID=UPI002041E770|nr:peptidoglycan-binding protein [Actinacidiphila cocklensis]MDD1059091.1 peptidoglycan-binding protein [Actinacidiphila cocklensis]
MKDRDAHRPADIVARPAGRHGEEPPDVIDVVFPAPRPGWRERPLLLCSLAVAGVALAAALAWQAWPQSAPAAEDLGAAPVAPDLAPPARKPVQKPLSKPLRKPAPTRVPAPHRTARPAAGPRVLRAGSRGPDVTDLQRLLFDQGFTYVSQTGVFDAATVRGVRQLQSDRGLICDPPGVYGICTRAALIS